MKMYCRFSQKDHQSRRDPVSGTQISPEFGQTPRDALHSRTSRKPGPRQLTLLALVFLCPGDLQNAEAQTPDKRTQSAQAVILIRGVDSAAAADFVRQVLSDIPGLQFKPVAVRQGTKPRFFSAPLTITIADTQKLNIGALATAFGKAERPPAVTRPLQVNLVLFTTARIDEPSVMNLRGVLRPVTGLEVDASGGLGGLPKQGQYWVQLEEAGGTTLRDVRQALQKANLPVHLQRPRAE